MLFGDFSSPHQTSIHAKAKHFSNVLSCSPLTIHAKSYYFSELLSSSALLFFPSFSAFLISSFLPILSMNAKE